MIGWLLALAPRIQWAVEINAIMGYYEYNEIYLGKHRCHR